MKVILFNKNRGVHVKFQCTKCGKLHSCGEWTRKTARTLYTIPMHRLQSNTSYICPSCSKVSYLKNINPVIFHNKEYKEEGWYSFKNRRSLVWF